MKIFFATNRDVGTSGAGVSLGNGIHGREGAFRVGEIDVEPAAGTWVVDPAGLSLSPETIEESVVEGRLVRNVVERGSDRLFASVREAALKEDTGDILILLHGAGHSLVSSLENMARCVELYSDPHEPLPADLSVGRVSPRRQMVPFALCYPTNGRANPVDYFLDRGDARLSGLALARTFVRLVKFVAALRRQDRRHIRIHLMAHSLGNFALRNAIQTIIRRPGMRPVRLFDSIFLLHADEDSDALFDPGKLAPLSRFTDRVAVYFDRSDKLTRLSDAVHVDRLGQKGPQRGRCLSELPCEVTAIDCGGATFDLRPDIQRHRHYFGARSVVDDIRQVIAGRPPHQVTGREPDPARPGFYRIVEGSAESVPPQ